MNRRIERIGWATILAMLLALIWFVHGAIVHAQSPTVIIAPNGSITYVYPGNPAVAIAPTGGITYVYPGNPSVAISPQSGITSVYPGMVPSVPVLPPILTPLPSYSYGGSDLR